MSIVYELLVKEEKILLAKLEEIRREKKRYESSSISAIESIAASVSEPLTSPKATLSENEVRELSNPQKILLALKENERFMKIREIAEYISQYTEEDVDNLVVQFSRRTKYLKDKNKIVKHQVGSSRKNTFWGSLNWLDKEGNIKEGYEYHKESVDGSQTTLIDL